MQIPRGIPWAEAKLRGSDAAPKLRGTVRFYQFSRYVILEARVKGLPQNTAGFFALHIHSGNSCEGSGFSGTLGHYDPTGMPHPGHAGDLPPLLSCGGSAYLAVMTNRFRLCDVIGRTVVIHSGADDFHSQPAGNAGTKIACGVITCPGKK